MKRQVVLPGNIVGLPRAIAFLIDGFASHSLFVRLPLVIPRLLTARSLPPPSIHDCSASSFSGNRVHKELALLGVKTWRSDVIPAPDILKKAPIRSRVWMVGARD